MSEVRIARLGPGDDATVLAASSLFDGPARSDATARFLRERGHHLFLAYDGDEPVGFVSAVELVHPDKGVELFLYELGVDESHRRQGIGASLLRELETLARHLGCYDMYVLTDRDNDAAVAAYTSTGAEEDGEHLMLTWRLDPDASG